MRGVALAHWPDAGLSMKRAAAGMAFVLSALPALAEDLPVFQLVAKGGRFEPLTLQVPVGKRFKIEIANEGPGAMEFESRDLKQEKVLAPGARSYVVINPLKAGTYKFFDDYHQDTAQGTIVAK
jgi:Cupredoxin-like domain